MDNRIRSNGASAGSAERRLGRGAALRRFFYLGLGVKRWLLVGAAGIAVCSIGLAFVIKNLFDLAFPNFLPWYFDGVVIAAAGLFVVALAVYGLYRSVGSLLLGSPPSFDSLAHTIYTRRSLGRGPRIVAIGGGTGLAVLLRGLKTHTDNLSAIITVADDGGSSGRLRQQLGVLPPGDFRNCLVAMSDTETLLGDLFQYRFDQGDGLEGHSFGNLFIVAMTNVTGSFETALYESSRVLAVHGQILPATIENLRLSARLADGTLVHGESSITGHGGSIERVLIEPEHAEALPRAVESIEQAQLIVIGPGSLYTSILPNLLVTGITRAIGDSNATKVFVSNVATQRGETDGYSVADHVAALQDHTHPAIVDYVLANRTPADLGSRFAGEPVTVGDGVIRHARLITEDVVDLARPVNHDPQKLADAVIGVYHGRHGMEAAVDPTPASEDITP